MRAKDTTATARYNLQRVLRQLVSEGMDTLLLQDAIRGEVSMPNLSYFAGDSDTEEGQKPGDKWEPDDLWPGV